MPSSRPVSSRAKKSAYNETVQVVIRCRPISEKEKLAECTKIVEVWPSRGLIEVTSPRDGGKENKKCFTFDAVFDWASSQESLYDQSVRPLVTSVLEGFNGCVFAYGQTGTGKTFTMEGKPNVPELHGMIPRTFEQIWSHINRTTNTQFLVTCSYLEIYMEEIRDLLKLKQTKTLEVRELDGLGVHVPNLHKVNCRSQDDMMRVMTVGNKHRRVKLPIRRSSSQFSRTIGATNMNERSSRSHAIFQIAIEMCNTESNTVQVGKLNLIDLAGSERQSKSGATDDRLREAAKINLALSSLGNVINALSEHAPHIPYRDSKLTRLLQDSLGGNSKTVMIANIGPASSNYEETLMTLRYAQRAKTIHNKPVKNEDPKDAKLREYQAEIARLKLLLAERQIKVGGKACPNGDTLTSDSDESDNDSVDEMIEKEKAEQARLLEMEKMETEELAKKLKNLERQLVKGGKNIVESMSETEVQLEKQRLEIAARKKREIELQQKLEQEEETTMGLRETFSTLQQEVEYKTLRLKKIYTKWQQVRNELKEMRESHNMDMREMEKYQETLVKSLRLKCLLLDNFIPPEERIKLFGEAIFDEEQDDWVLGKPSIDFNMDRPIANISNRRPVSEFTLLRSCKSNNPRYRLENVIDITIDKPLKTTQVYTAPELSPYLKDILTGALKKETISLNIDVVEPPQSFQPRSFPRRELEKRFEKLSKSMSEVSPMRKAIKQVSRDPERVRSSYPPDKRSTVVTIEIDCPDNSQIEIIRG